jgi:predicted phage terminase large subunit-like protein
VGIPAKKKSILDYLNPIEKFAAVFLMHDLRDRVPLFHHEMYQLACSGLKRIVICAPRSFAKSTVFSKIYPLFQILEGTARRIFIVSATGTLAEHWLAQIRTELESNARILMHFGDVKTDKWTQSHIICRRGNGTECELVAKGAGYQIRGYRPDVVIIDDIETDEHVTSSDQREKLLNWFNKALINTLEKDSQLVMIGTLLHPLSLLADVMEREGWEVRKYQAIKPNGKSLWPEKWPLEALETRRKEIGSRAFNSEFQNEPIISENPIFIKEWFKGYEPESEAFKKHGGNGGLHTVIACDPAIAKKEGSDFTALVALSATFEKEPKYYVRKVVRGHWPINRQVAEIVRLYDEYTASKLIVETVAYQEALADEVRRWCEDNHRHIQISPIKPDRDKERRAHAVAPTVERGQVYFDMSDPGQQGLMTEMMIFPTGDHDDRVDAYVYAQADLNNWTHRKSVGRIRSAYAGAW